MNAPNEKEIEAALLQADRKSTANSANTLSTSKRWDGESFPWTAATTSTRFTDARGT